MGLFDNLTCKYPLEFPEVQGRQFQTKDTPAQYLEDYEIREDGSLWHCEVKRRFIDDDTHIRGYRVEIESEQWHPVTDFTGSIDFYPEGETPGFEYEFIGWFRDGQLKDLSQKRSPSPSPPAP